MFVDILFTRGDEREKGGIRKAWAEKKNELVMWKRSGGETQNDRRTSDGGLERKERHGGEFDSANQQHGGC